MFDVNLGLTIKIEFFTNEDNKNLYKGTYEY